MPVEDVYTPGTSSEIDPRTLKERNHADESDADYWEKKTRAATARREYNDATAGPAESPFQIKGSVNLGDFDFTKQADELKERMTTISENAQREVSDLKESNLHYRDELQKIQLTMVEKSLGAQIESLQKTMREGSMQGHDGDILDQVEKIKGIAGALGYEKVGATAGVSSELQLSILKMENDESQRQREFEWDKIQDERRWKIELLKLEQVNTATAAQVVQEKDRRSAWATPFESIGAALAKGLKDSGGVIPGTSSETPKKRSNHKLSAELGDSVTLECPDCGNPVVIAPTTKKAVCAGCESTFTVERSAPEDN